jgi:hypothetical protein
MLDNTPTNSRGYSPGNAPKPANRLYSPSGNPRQNIRTGAPTAQRQMGAVQQRVSPLRAANQYNRPAIPSAVVNPINMPNRNNRSNPRNTNYQQQQQRKFSPAIKRGANPASGSAATANKGGSVFDRLYGKNGPPSQPNPSLLNKASTKSIAKEEVSFNFGFAFILVEKRNAQQETKC